MPSTFLRTYLSELAQIRSQGVAETSFYPPLDKLLNAVGQTLPTPVIHITHPKAKGAGLPDGGFFTPEQLKGEPNTQALTPSRGVCEVKGTGANLATLLKSAQVRKYLERYGQVLATNLYSFAVVELAQEGGKQVVRLIEQYDLADSEEAFWQQAANPQAVSDLQAERFIEFLRRALMRRASLSRPVDLALFLASYAKEARLRLEVSGTAELSGLRNALEELLGVSFRTDQGEHFFRATLVQTLFYGLFSAWVIHHEAGNTAPFNWRGAAFDLHLRVLQRLFSEVAKPAAMRSMNLVGVMDQAQEVLDRVNREAFFARFSGAHAVQYFYEPFLAAYDPELREQFGVWYTPDEVVTYMVEQVDRALRDDLGLPLGLASEEVVILDPCTGTGTYILKVLERIQRTLEEEGQLDAFSGQDLKNIALKRIFGFELMPAPFVVAHMRLNMQLKKFGFELSEDERLGVYLTNALTGYEDKGSPDLAHFGEFLSEWQESSHVKQKEPVLVVIGNPPYSSYAGIGVKEERELGDAYRDVANVPKPVGHGLNDLYVRFFRMAERQITHPRDGKERQGVVCYISNYSWLDGLSHTGMRERYLNAFDKIRVDNLNGDRFRTGKVTPEGKPDPSIFSTPFNREGIQVGTAIALMVRKEGHKPAEAVQYRELWGAGKLEQLAQEAMQGAQPEYTEVKPELRLGAPFRPTEVSTAYLQWPKIEELFPVSFSGVTTSRDAALVDIDEDRLRRRMSLYFDKEVSDGDVKAEIPVLLEPTRRFQAERIRTYLKERGLRNDLFVPYAYRPFDVRWLYWEPETKLLDEKRENLFDSVAPENLFIVTQQKPRRDWSPPQVVRPLGSYDLMDRGASLFPLYIKHVVAVTPDGPQTELRPNLSALAYAYLQDHSTVTHLSCHALAVMHSLAYRTENDGALRQDWPRIPLPPVLEHLQASAELGKQVAALLDQTATFKASTEVKAIGEFRTVDGKTPTAEDLKVSMRWGYLANGAVMPGRGRTEPVEAAFDSRLGTDALRVYLSPNLYLDNVPLSVWEYKLGGYQVVKKWLSYREVDVLGRALEVTEIRELRATLQRIASLLLLSDELDANYRRVSAPAVAQEAAPNATAEA